ncbi:MAG: glycerol dehydrogenase [Rhabdochlamydiaceae bacterium]|nr:glycerol dehydrogenase [Rhabdochlamydiaceae bacterium]
MCTHPLRVYAGPSRYVQGRGAFLQIAAEIKKIGIRGKAFIVVSKTAERATRPLWEKSLQEEGLPFSVYPFGGECSSREIEKIVSEAKGAKADYFIAIGGGKAIDAARAAAEVLEMETVICPSIASTDAPCIALSVIYSDSGEMQEFRLHRKNPILVLVDSEVISKAPKRFLIAGMGDALSTYYEARTCKSTYTVNPRGGLQTETGIAIAKLCRDILLEDGVSVVSSYETQGVTPAFERIIEANVLLSGMGVELCHVAGAHAIHNGLTQLKETHSCYHGEKVAFGLIVQLVLEGADPAEIYRLLDFYKQVGLPSTFKQIGIHNPTEEMLLQVAKRATINGETMSHEPFSVCPHMVIDAMRYADCLGEKCNAGKLY